LTEAINRFAGVGPGVTRLTGRTVRSVLTEALDRRTELCFQVAGLALTTIGFIVTVSVNGLASVGLCIACLAFFAVALALAESRNVLTGV
jgi:hypothetical protein